MLVPCLVLAGGSGLLVLSGWQEDSTGLRLPSAWE